MNTVTLVSSATCCCDGGVPACDETTPNQAICVCFTEIIVRENPGLAVVVSWSGTACVTARWSYDTAALDPPYVTQLATATIDLGGGYTGEISVWIRCLGAGGFYIEAQVDVYDGMAFLTTASSFPIVDGIHHIGPFTDTDDAAGSYNNDELVPPDLYWAEASTTIAADPCDPLMWGEGSWADGFWPDGMWA